MSNPERDELYAKIVQEILQDNKKKHEAELKKKVGTKIFFIGIVCATLILIMVAKTLAWFNNGTKSKVSPIDFTVEDAPTLQIADYPLDGGWKDSLQVSFFPLKPICGNGNDFYLPLIEKVQISNSNGIACYKKQVVGIEDFNNGETISSDALVKEFQMRSLGEDVSALYLSADCSLVPDVAESTGSSINSDGLNTSLIAGAMRVAFYYWDDTEEKYILTAIWITNPKIELVESDGIWSAPSSSIQLDGSVVSDGNPETKYYLVNSVGRFDDNSVNSTAIDYTDVGYFIESESGIIYFWDVEALYNSGTPLFGALTSNSEKRFKLVIWVEGTDRECENALLGGKMGLNLTFTQVNPNA